MKKTIIVIILAVYIASIAIVNFFGLEVKVYDSETYISFIEIVEISNIGNGGTLVESFEKEPGTGSPIYYFDFIPPDEGETYTLENIDTNPNMLQIDFLLMSNKDDIMAYKDGMIKFIYDDSQGTAIYDEDLQVLVFLKPDQDFTLTLLSTDLLGAKTSIIIQAVSKE